MIEHHIQADIVSRLSHAKSLRFRDLKPKSLESNLFMYHLKQLIKNDYVEKVKDGYQLSAKGLTYIDMLSTETGKPRKQPKLLTLIALKNDAGQWLLAKRKVQPFIDSYMFPTGKQHFDESFETHLTRESEEQLGTKMDLTHRGFIDIRIHRKGVILTHVVSHVYCGIYNGDAPSENTKYSYTWSVLRPEMSILAGTRELAQLIEKDQAPILLSLDLEE